MHSLVIVNGKESIAIDVVNENLGVTCNAHT